VGSSSKNDLLQTASVGVQTEVDEDEVARLGTHHHYRQQQQQQQLEEDDKQSTLVAELLGQLDQLRLDEDIMRNERDLISRKSVVPCWNFSTQNESSSISMLD